MKGDFLMKQNQMNAKKIVTLAMLAAVAFVVMYLSKLVFRPFAVAGFLTFDLKDVIIAIAGFIFGPLSAFFVSVVVSLIEMVTVSDTGLIGFVMNVLSTCAFACVASAIYSRRRDMAGAVLGLLCGLVAMTAVMLLWNYLITPLYMKVTREQVAAMLLPVFMPFNLVKAAMNAAVTLLLYKPLVGALRKARLLPETAGGGKGSVKLGVILPALFVLVTSILLVLVLSGKL